MLLVKSGVQPKSIIILAAIANESMKLSHDVVITAGLDGIHNVNSKHYMLGAIDVRSHNFPSKEAKMAFLDAVVARLGQSYIGLLEYEGTPKEHFHIQFK